jgi:hypothetical protein
VWHESFDQAGSPVLDMLGVSARWNRGVTLEDKDADRDPGMSALYAQYCNALSSPLATEYGNWVGSECDARHTDIEVEGGADWGVSAAHAPIAKLLTDINTVEEAFGVLSDIEPLQMNEEVPEILALFAPLEYHTATSRGSGGVPPELARREHHALSIDSPVRVAHR